MTLIEVLIYDGSAHGVTSPILVRGVDLQLHVDDSGNLVVRSVKPGETTYATHAVFHAWIYARDVSMIPNALEEKEAYASS